MANPSAVGGKFHDCPSGWACYIINNNNLKAAGAEAGGLERFQHGSGETLQTSIAAAYADQAPCLDTTWRQLLFLVSIQWFVLKCQLITLTPTPVMAM